MVQRHWETPGFWFVIVVKQLAFDEVFVKIVDLISNHYKKVELYSNFKSNKKEGGVIEEWQEVVFCLNEEVGCDSIYLEFDIPVWIQDSKGSGQYLTEQSGVLLYGEVNEDGDPLFAFDFYANAFTDSNVVYLSDDSEVIVDQSVAAQKNRDVLISFVKEVENVLCSSVLEWGSDLFEDKYIYKYGYRENVKFS